MSDDLYKRVIVPQIRTYTLKSIPVEIRLGHHLLVDMTHKDGQPRQKWLLTSLDRVQMSRGTLFIVSSPVACNRNLRDFLSAVGGNPVTIDGAHYELLGLESFVLPSPLVVGDKIGLLVGPWRETLTRQPSPPP